jgi:hypothetical protein
VLDAVPLSVLTSEMTYETAHVGILWPMAEASTPSVIGSIHKHHNPLLHRVSGTARACRRCTHLSLELDGRFVVDAVFAPDGYEVAMHG